jgi:hypothetical protein
MHLGLCTNYLLKNMISKGRKCDNLRLKSKAQILAYSLGLKSKAEILAVPTGLQVGG